ncbi:hypothetical protein RvY_18161 [Ramazzottius varieornatus]|uniref:Uncharacterized protein n=1 Tax=Ramazzottius varieornatus TaxID=947166 RepID=A0A1D1W877_RAMVA|nr:hypothetical protein RvY_18161 [Ramazzottius varieornatus]
MLGLGLAVMLQDMQEMVTGGSACQRLSGEYNPHLQRSTEQEGQLIEWLEDPANYALYKGARKNNLTGKLKTTGTTKAPVYRKISVYLAEHGVQRDCSMVKNKIVNLERGYKAALVFLGGTGSGCHNPDPERPTY